MSKRNLLICFDAFGTLFKPKRPVEEQYTAVAHKFGLGLISDGTSQFDSADVRASFRKALKNSAKEFPNYGRAVGMGATAWWTQVIQNTFTPLLPPSQRSNPLPPSLAPTLLHRFSSAEGYCEPSPSLQTLFRRLRSISSLTNRKSQQSSFDRLIMGVITNSDDRVQDILSTFGLRVSPLRFGSSAPAPALSSDERAKGVLIQSEKGASVSSNTDGPETGQQVSDFDVDFTCISYDVGFEKPDKRIFEAAEVMVGQVIGRVERVDTGGWLRIYVGDEYRADVVGALGAGWNAVWIPDMDGGGDVVSGGSDLLGEHKTIEEMVYLDGDTVREISVGDVFGGDAVVEEGGEGQLESKASVGHTTRGSEASGRVIRCSSLEVLVEWLTVSK